MVKIDKDVPLPTSKAIYNTGNNRIIKSMEVGDSMFFPDANNWTIYQRFFNIAKRLGKHIVVRKVEGGVRMWRDK